MYVEELIRRLRRPIGIVHGNPVRDELHPSIAA